MSASGERLSGLVADANVLIDYVEADRTVLSVISRSLARIHVPSPVLAEVRALSEKDASALGLDVVEPTLSQAMEAQAGGGPTSFQDRLCLLVARAGGWAVMTNDRALRNACGEAGVPCLWGLETLGLLVADGTLSAQRALAVANRIARVNRFITSRILDAFRKRIGL